MGEVTKKVRKKEERVWKKNGKAVMKEGGVQWAESERK